MTTTLDFFFSDSTKMGTFRALTEPPLGSAIETYAQRMRDENFARQTAREYLRLLGCFNRWLRERRCTAESIGPDLIQQFREHFEPRKLRKGFDCIFRHFLQIVRPDLCVHIPSALEVLLQGFRDYLSNERGLVPSTVYASNLLVEKFLKKQIPEGSSGDLSKVSPELIANWVKQNADRTSAANAKHIVTALRSFFSYTFYRRLTDRNFATCVPGAPSWSLADLPRHLSRDQVQKVIKTFDKKRRAGKRDFAILLLLARLGLRAGEIAALTLEDVDWEVGVITVRGKSRRTEQVPLPQEVGEAIADYLFNARPKCKSRQIFLTARAPYHGIKRGAISTLATWALVKADVSVTQKGAHVFRHSLATTMLKNGASLRQIGEVLRHRRIDTTRIYAKVDVSSLRKLALPWPGGSR
jgi:integrase/recombinase XerD